MKKVTSLLTFPMNYLKRWVGAKARRWTSALSERDSSSTKSNQTILKKLAELALENQRLKEELRLIHLELNKEYDV